MEKQIKLFKNNENKDWTDEKWIVEFFNFLQGDIPEGISLGEGKLELSKDQAYNVLWYLREHFPILPDFFCQCDVCKEIYNSDNSGYYSEKGNDFGNSFCNACNHLASDYEYDEDEDLINLER